VVCVEPLRDRTNEGVEFRVVHIHGLRAAKSWAEYCFGFGMALMEGTVADETTGRIVNPNPAEYHAAVHADTPEFDIDFINEPDPHMPDLGARGIGEIGIVGAPAAVANAVFNATGKRVRDLPITPDKLIIRAHVIMVYRIKAPKPGHGN